MRAVVVLVAALAVVAAGVVAWTLLLSLFGVVDVVDDLPPLGS